MSLFGLFNSRNDSDLYSDTNDDGDTDEYMYRLEDDDSFTPVSKSEYKSMTDDLYKSGYYDDISTDDDDEPKKGWLGLW